MLFGLPGFIQEAALAALGAASQSEAWMREFCASRLELLSSGLRSVPGLACCMPDAGMFMLVDVRQTGLTGYDFMRGLYESERVSVLDGGAFGADTAGFVRIFYGTDPGRLREAVVRIRRYVASLAKLSDERSGGGR
jgi:aspartate/methionine/tyrosine aminotransferase